MNAITLALIIAGMILVPVMIWFIIWNKSFIHKVWIAKQSGKEIKDVIWVEDKFKVVDKEGEHVIILKRHTGRAPSFSGDLWTKFFKNKSISFSDENWVNLELKKHISRGLFLYQTTEGEFHPIGMDKIDERFKFVVLPQDNRGFIIRSIMNAQKMALSNKKQMIIYLSIVGAIVVLGIAFVLWLIYMTDSAANICHVTTQGGGFVDTAKNVLVGG